MMTRARGRVYVYRNLNTGTWSVRALDGEHRGHVIAHPAEVTLTDAAFHVSVKGRDRVRSTGIRCVHAGVSGYLAPLAHGRAARGTTGVTYNPFRTDGFVSLTDGSIVTRAALVHFPRQPRGGSAPLRAVLYELKEADE